MVSEVVDEPAGVGEEGGGEEVQEERKKSKKGEKVGVACGRGLERCDFVFCVCRSLGRRRKEGRRPKARLQWQLW